MADLFGPITSRWTRIGNFDSFILSNIPYAHVQPDALQWGAIDFDGPTFVPNKPTLQWHFGGVPYPITRAVRVWYTYKRTWDASNELVTAAIYLGFQENVENHLAPRLAFPTQEDADAFRGRAANLGPHVGVPPRFLASPSAVLASQASSLISGAVAANPPTLTELIRTELQVDQAFLNRLPNQEERFLVDYDGPAQDNDSHNVFQYSLAQLFQEPDKYSQLLWWYFGGVPWRLTKALRIPLDAQLAAGDRFVRPRGAMFIGYAGLGSGGNG